MSKGSGLRVKPGFLGICQVQDSDCTLALKLHLQATTTCSEDGGPLVRNTPVRMCSSKTSKPGRCDLSHKPQAQIDIPVVLRRK